MMMGWSMWRATLIVMSAKRNRWQERLHQNHVVVVWGSLLMCELLG